jgi:hypothetical protein
MLLTMRHEPLGCHDRWHWYPLTTLDSTELTLRIAAKCKQRLHLKCTEACLCNYKRLQRSSSRKETSSSQNQHLHISRNPVARVRQTIHR